MLEFLGFGIGGSILFLVLAFFIFLICLTFDIVECFLGRADFSLVKDYYGIMGGLGQLLTGNETVSFIAGVGMLCIFGFLVGCVLSLFKK